MPTKGFPNNFSKGVALDFSQQSIPENVAIFIKNMTKDMALNPGASSGAGFDAGEWTPIEGNTALELPSTPVTASPIYCVGTFYSQQTNELYFFMGFPSGASVNALFVMDSTGVIQLVFQGAQLPTNADPSTFIAEGRCTMELREIKDPVTGVETNFKFLIFTNSVGNQSLIEITSCIATSGYTTPSGAIGQRFYGSGSFYDPSELTLLGVPTPNGQIGIVPLSSTPDDLLLQNNMVREGYQFRVKFIDIFGRESEHGIISDNYISGVGGGCIQTSNGMPRCVDITFPSGNPFVQNIVIEYRQWVGDDRGGVIATNWKQYDTITKWVGDGIEWWEQNVDTTGVSFTWDSATNLITYKFCGDRNSIPIEDAETARTQPGIPRTSNGVASVGTSIVLSNNTYGFQPISPAAMALITLGVTTPDVGCAAPPTRTIQFFVVISDPSTVTGASGGGIKDIFKNGTIFGFGDPATPSTIDHGDQIFGDQTHPGFIFYVAGQPQYNCITERGIIDSATYTFTPLPIGTANTNAGAVIVHRATLLVPASKVLIRAASHKSTTTDYNLQNTSTYIGGIGQVGDLFSLSGRDLNSYVSNPLKEIQVDCSGSDILLNGSTDHMFILLSLAAGFGRTLAGYLKEDASVNSSVGIEMQPVFFAGGNPSSVTTDKCWGSFYTDHNGFYFATCVNPTPGTYVQMKLDVCDGTGATKIVTLINNSFNTLYGYGTGTVLPGSGALTAGNYLNIVSYYTGIQTYNSLGRITVSLNCVTNIGGFLVNMPGIPVCMTKGGYDLSDNNGHVEILSHNRYSYPIEFHSGVTLPFLGTSVRSYSYGSGNANDDLVYSQRGGCTWTVDTCSYTRPNYTLAYQPCTGLDRTSGPSIPSLFVVNGINVRGVQSGGRYSVGWLFYDILGRHTFVQTDIVGSLINVPNINDVTTIHPSQTFNLCSITYNISPYFAVDPTFVYMTPAISENLLFSDFFSWSADWIQFVDNSGNNNSANPTAVRIYYQSLNEYNKQNNFATNTGWEVITTSSTNSLGTPVAGDVIQFIANGNAAWITSVLSSPISYDRTGAFMTVEYTAAMAALTNGCLFRVIRPKPSSTNHIYYEQNLVIKLVNGQVADSTQLTGVLPYYDSYMLNRTIPVPILNGQNGPIPPGQAAPSPIQYTSSRNTTATSYSTDNINNANNVVIMSVNDATISFPFFFESPSPSDFWGSHLANRGRVHVKNAYEAEYRLGTEFLSSAALGSRPNSFNGLSYFESKNSKIFDRNQYGNIVAVIVQTGSCLVICDTDWFITNYNQSNLTLDVTGNVVGQKTGDSPFTDPLKKSGGVYGCTLPYINTIRYYDGVTYWLDYRGRLVKCNFSNAIDVSEPAGYYGWLLQKLSLTKQTNAQSYIYGTTYFVAGIDPKTKEYYLTSFNIPINYDIPLYINSFSEPSVSLNDTIVVDLETGLLKGFASATPEYYGAFPGYDLQKNFFLFNQCVPWLAHNFFANGPWANFFGIQCPCILTGVANAGSELVKRYLWMEVYCDTTLPVMGGFPTPLFQILDEKILTEKQQVSRILTPNWTFRNNFATAAFLCATNTPPDSNLPIQTGANAVLDGDHLQGRWLQYSLQTQDSYDGRFFKLTSVIIFVNHVKKSGE